MVRRSPAIRVELVGVGEVHAACLKESRTRGRVQRSVQVIESKIWDLIYSGGRRITENYARYHAGFV
jgi:hypothetical protein